MFRSHHRALRGTGSRRRFARPAVMFAAIASLAATAGVTSTTQASTLFFPHDLAVQTNDLYDHDCFWGGPRGMDFAALPDPQPIQIPNLYPDKGSTYFPAQFTMPVGSSLTIKGTYPRERYFSFTVANQLGNGSVGNGDYLRDVQINPDPGSVNPFLQDPNDRTPAGQTYTLRVLRGAPPATRPANTIYTTSTSATSPIRLAMRNYIPDQGIGGTGGVDLPRVTLTLSDGTTITDPAAVCTALAANKDSTPTGFPTAAYLSLIAGSADPVNAPAATTPVFERFWNNAYSILGIFTADPLARVQTYGTPQPDGTRKVNDDGGFATNPDTAFVAAPLSLNFGKVVALSVKPPTYAHTRPGATQWSPASSQVRYWSACTAEGPISGKGSDCAYDQQVPLDQNGNWKIVISRPEDRPANANTICGAKWLDFGIGEGDYPGARSWEAVVYMRYMASDPNWAQNPKYRTGPTTADPANHLSDWMGAYAPRAHYESQSQFEANGCAGPRLAASSGTPNTGAFALDWNAVTNDLPQLYTLQHKSANGAWSTVATDLTSASRAFPAGAPEGEGTWTYRVGAIDVSSAETAPSEADFGPASDPVKVDQSAPMAPSASADRAPDYAGGGGWYRDAVTVSFTDNGDPALADGSAGSGVDPSTLTAPRTVTANGSSTVSGTVKDRAGNESAAGSLSVQVDAKAPSLQMTCPAVLLLNGSGSATTTASDDESGLAGDPSGSTAIDTSSAGPKTIAKTATDNVGHTTAGSCTTQVRYMYSGLLQPVNPDGSSIFKLGSTVPLRFDLTDFGSLPVSGAMAKVYLAKVDNSIEGSFLEGTSTSTADSGNTFRDTGAGSYQFNLATKALTAGTYDVKLVLDDGTSYVLRISLR